MGATSRTSFEREFPSVKDAMVFSEKHWQELGVERWDYNSWDRIGDSICISFYEITYKITEVK